MQRHRSLDREPGVIVITFGEPPMHWIQMKSSNGTSRRSIRYKCNRCGITEEVPYEFRTPTPTRMPDGWEKGNQADWHFCPTCEDPSKGSLPILYD